MFREEELPIPDKFLALYAESKAYAEVKVSEANFEENPTLLTIAVAPHQVYGPHDALFLPSLLETAGNGRLRIFGNGQNKIRWANKFDIFLIYLLSKYFVLVFVMWTTIATV